MPLEGSSLTAECEPILNTSAPIYALQSVIPSEDDATFVDFMESEMLTLRQIDEEGTVHTICLSPLMVAEVARLFDGFIHLPASLTSTPTKEPTPCKR